MKKQFAFFAVFVMLVVSFFGVSSDGQDVDYVAPPAADNIISISMSCKSDDPTYHVELNEDYSDVAGDLAEELGRAYSTTSIRNGLTATEAQCTPSWISYDVVSERDYTHLVAPDWCVTLNISPALQQVAEDTHGDYWIWFKISSSGAVFSSGWDHTYLIKIHLDVKWNGSVIVKDTVYHNYVLKFDSLGGDVQQSYYYSVLANLDNGIHLFDTTSVAPVREGYNFKGWSTVSSGSQPLDVSDDYPFQSKDADRVDKSNPNNVTYYKTIYAVWEYQPYQDLPDFLREIVTLLSDPGVLAIIAVFVIGLAFIVRQRRKAMWGDY